MPMYKFDMTDSKGNETYDLVTFPSLDEAKTHTPIDKDCVITNISIYNPDSPVFEFEALDSEGNWVNDIIEAPTETEAKSTIEGMGYSITKFSGWKNDG